MFLFFRFTKKLFDCKIADGVFWARIKESKKASKKECAKSKTLGLC